MNGMVLAPILSILAAILPISTTPYDWGEVDICVSNNSPKVGETVELQVIVRLKDGYYIYSPTTKAGYPTSLSFNKPTGFKAIGALSAGKAKSKWDSGLEGQVQYYVGTATFIQKVKITAAGKRQFNGSINAQVCNPETCVPFFLDFDFNLETAKEQKSGPKDSVKSAVKAPARGERAGSKSEKLKLGQEDFTWGKVEIELSNKSPKIGEAVELRVYVTMTEGTHIYSTTTKAGLQTSLTFDKPTGFRAVGKLKGGKFKTKFDQNFDAEVEIHEVKATFVQRIKITGDVGKRLLKGSFSGLTCDANNCSPLNMDFSAAITATALAEVNRAPIVGSSKKVLAAIDSLMDKLNVIESNVDKLATTVEDNHSQLKALGKKNNKGKFFDEVLSYHHQWDKGLAAAKKSGKQLFVVFTGHFCTNCRRMEGTVLVEPKVTKILEAYERVVLHVDKPGSQEEKDNYKRLLKLGGKGPIPAYYILKANGEKISSHTGLASTETFVSFLKDGKPVQDMSWFGFIITCIGLGLLTLIMPCTYPMIPITISVFSKGSELSKAIAFKRASIYALGIVVSYTAVGGIVQIIMGGAGQQAIQNFANNGIVNLFIGVIFIYFAFSFFGYYEIAMPSFLRNLMQFGQPTQDKDGGVPAWSLFLMGAFFMLTSYSCGAPFVLAVFEQASQTDHPLSVVFALFLFSSTLAIPFLFLALVPGAIRSMPRAGGWFTTFKVTLGFFELAFALKFLSTSDIAFNIAFLTRPVFLGLWILIFSLLGLYLLGFMRFPHDPKTETVSMGRFSLAIMTFTLAIYLSSWFVGQKLEANLDALMPPERYPSLVNDEKAL
jgi:thiol:disulfide interchange protein